METKNLHQNSVMVINAYKDGAAWMFDDERVGLLREGLVAGADTICEKFNLDGSGKVTITFSKLPFPGRNVKLLMQDTVEDGDGGTTYYYPDDDHTVWLCPALLKYFPTPPLIIYAQLKQNS